MIGEDKTRVVVTITKEMKQDLDLLAENDMRNVSNYIATVLANHINTLPDDSRTKLNEIKIDKKNKLDAINKEKRTRDIKAIFNK